MKSSISVAAVAAVILSTALASLAQEPSRRKQRDAQLTEVLELLAEMRQEVRELKQEVRALREAFAERDSRRRPAETEGAARQTDITDLKSAIRDQLLEIARGDAELKKLKSELSRKLSLQMKAEADIVKLREFLQSGERKLQVAGRSYTVETVKQDLQARFARLKQGEAEVLELKTKLQRADDAQKLAQERLKVLQTHLDRRTEERGRRQPDIPAK